MVELSVVVPVYGCADCLEALYQRLSPVLQACASSYEIILVDDCAPDGAWQVIRRLSEQDPRVRGLRLSRNFGQHAAITAGLAECAGERAVVMDCDLQDPPEAIPALVQRARAASARSSRASGSLLPRSTFARSARSAGIDSTATSAPSALSRGR
jgi:glycosyltransferase involved in cell wall biosynthesis